jgi:hypothetical protein
VRRAEVMSDMAHTLSVACKLFGLATVRTEVMNAILLRTSQPSKVETLQRELSALVAARQELHAARASQEQLEQNRLEIAQRQWELSYALIERHLPHTRAA